MGTWTPGPGPTNGDDTFVGDGTNETADGGAGNDTLSGNGGNDTLTGGGGNDALDGGNGNDTLVSRTFGDSSASGSNTYDGGTGVDYVYYGWETAAHIIDLAAGTAIRADGVDTLISIENVFAGSGADDITGDANANFLYGGSGDDILRGAGGDDTLVGRFGLNTIYGGQGNDLYVVERPTDVIVENVAEGIDTIHVSPNGASIYDLSAAANVENFQVSRHSSALTLTANSEDNLIFVGVDSFSSQWWIVGGLPTQPGPDTVYAGGGNDIVRINGSYSNEPTVTFFGEAGNDTLTGGVGADTLDGGEGNDTLDGGIGADFMYGGDGNDTYVVDSAGDVVTESSGQGTDLVQTTLAAYTLGANLENLTFTGAGAFTGTGNSAANTITGGASGDTLYGGTGADTLNGGGGDDQLFANETESAVDILNGGDNSDNLYGNSNDVFIGGTGFDFARVDYGDAASVDFRSLSVVGGVISGALPGGGTLDGIEVLVTSISGNYDFSFQGSEGLDVISAFHNNADTEIRLEGNGGNDQLGTGAGRDTLLGGAGNDILDARGGNDFLDGGTGADAMYGGAGDDTYVVDNASDVVSELASEGVDLLQTTLNSYALGANVENLTFTGAGNFSGMGNTLVNVITGGAGADTLNGGTGADTLIGGAGNDTYVIDNSLDVVIENSGEGTDLVETALAVYTLGANLENLTFASTGSFTGTGNAAANTITGGASSDNLDGGAGADTLIGGGGNDIYVVDNVGDVVIEGNSAGADQVRTTLSTYALGANIENLTYTGFDPFNGIGNSLSNTLTGGNGNDTLSGGAGNDTLAGAGGTDTAVFSGARSNYTVTSLGNGDVQVVDNRGGSPDGTDTLSGVEFLQFSDQTLAAPTVDMIAGSTATTSTITIGGVNQTSMIDTLGDHDWFRVALTAGQTYVFSLIGSGGAPLFDPLLQLRNSGGTLLATNDDAPSGATLNSVLTYTAASSGTYYLDAQAYANSYTGEYTLSASTTADTIAASTSTSASITVGGASLSSSLYAGDHDWVRVTLSAGQSYAFSVTASGTNLLSDPFLALRDSSGALVSLDDDGGTGVNSLMHFTATASGTYYLEVRGSSDAEAGDYTVSAVTGPPQDPLDTLDLGFTVNHTNISVYFATSGQNFGAESASRSWTASEITAAMSAFSMYSVATALTFTQVGSAAGADFVMSIASLSDFVLGVTYPGGPSGQALMEFDPTGIGWSSTSMQPGSYGFVTLVHEIGHALGLDHPHLDGDDNQVMQGVISPFNSYGTFSLDQGVFTTMGYNAGWPLGPNGLSPSYDWGWQAGPMALDIAALQQRYGTNATANGGNNTYTISSTSGLGVGVSTIWDTGGLDTIVANNGAGNATIDLRPATLLNAVGGGGYVSYVSGFFGGFTIANGVVIENATGGGGNDTIIGNAANNILSGGGGNDTLRGLTGSNTLDGGTGVNTADYSWTTTGVLADLGAGSNQAVSLGGGAEAFTDQLTNIQRVLGGSGADTEIFRSVAPGTVLSFIGGAGVDTADFSNFVSAVSIELSYAGVEGWTRDGPNVATGTWRSIVGLDVENIRGSAYDDYLQGNGADNVLYYTSGHDRFDGMGNGASGDTVDFSAFGSAIWVDLTATGGDEAYTRDGTTVLTGTERGIADIANVERVVGTAYDDQLCAAGDTRSLLCGGGNDTLFVRATNVGNIVTLDGGAGVNTADFSRFGAAVWIDLSYVGNEAWTRDTTNLTTTGNWREIGDINGVASLVGSNYDDYLHGDAAANTIIYNGGFDRIDGGGGTDTLDFSRFGSAVWVDLSTNELYTKDHANLVGGTWRAVGTSIAVENLIGTGDDDYLKGDSAANMLDGGTGDDTLIGAGGADTLIGGAGSNTASYAGSAAVTVNLSTNSASGGDAAGDTFSNIQNVTGSSFADSLTGTSGANVLDGGAGADTLVGLAGNDIYVVDNIGDAITEASNEGTDLVRSSVGNYTLGANVENYQFVGSGTYTAHGNGGDNTFFVGTVAAGAFANLDGAGGTDTADFSGFGAAVWIDLAYSGYEGWTRDTTDLVSGTYREMADLTGVENLVGSAYDDLLRGDGADNTIFYTGGVDRVFGGGGTDTLDFSRFGSAVWVDLAAGELYTKDHGNLVGGTWRAIGTSTAVENLIGTSGDDFVFSAAGANAINGDTGINTVSYAGSNAGVTVDLSSGGPASGGYAAGDVLTNIQNVTGSSFADSLTGTSGANVLDGGAGADTLVGLAGNDTYVVDNALDAITEASNEGTDLVRSSVGNYTLGANVENYQFVGSGTYMAHGNGGDNTFFVGTVAAGTFANLDGAGGTDTADFSGFGAAVWIDLAYSGYEGWTRDTSNTTSGAWREIADLTGIENLVGSAYDDRISGDGVNNTFTYTGGTDIIDGRAGTDTLDFSRFGSAVWVDLAAGELYTKDHGNLVGGTWRQIGTAAQVENLVGTSGDDYLRGDSAANTLEGGAGNNTLIGGAGADDFLYRASAGGAIAAGHDMIIDFVRGLDHIELDTVLSASDALAALHIAASGADSLVTFDGSASFQIAVAGVHLDSSDFLFT